MWQSDLLASSRPAVADRTRILRPLCEGSRSAPSLAYFGAINKIQFLIRIGVID